MAARAPIHECMAAYSSALTAAVAHVALKPSRRRFSCHLRYDSGHGQERWQVLSRPLLRSSVHAVTHVVQEGHCIAAPLQEALLTPPVGPGP